MQTGCAHTSCILTAVCRFGSAWRTWAAARASSTAWPPLQLLRWVLAHRQPVVHEDASGAAGLASVSGVCAAVRAAQGLAKPCCCAGAPGPQHHHAHVFLEAYIHFLVFLEACFLVAAALGREQQDAREEPEAWQLLAHYT